MPLLSRLPGLALGAALVVFTLSLFVGITSGEGVAQPLNLILIVLLALTIGLFFLVQNPNNDQAALMLWFGAGVWSAAAYLNFQLLGLLDLVVAGLAIAGAFVVERERRAFSFAGPAIFLATSSAIVVISRVMES